MNLILSDAAAVPSVFRWNGPVDIHVLNQWISAHQWDIPADLLRLWEATGGGEVFETEMFLPPAPGGDRYDGVAEVTQFYREDRGLMDGLVLFHQGSGLSAVNLLTRRYVYFDSDAGRLRPTGEYVSLNQWYMETIRAEYFESYGLPRLPGDAGQK